MDMNGFQPSFSSKVPYANETRLNRGLALLRPYDRYIEILCILGRQYVTHEKLTTRTRIQSIVHSDLVLDCESHVRT